MLSRYCHFCIGMKRGFCLCNASNQGEKMNKQKLIVYAKKLCAAQYIFIIAAIAVEVFLGIVLVQFEYGLSIIHLFIFLCIMASFVSGLLGLICSAAVIFIALLRMAKKRKTSITQSHLKTACTFFITCLFPVASMIILFCFFFL